MLAGRTFLRCLLAFVDVTAVAALPVDLAVALEEAAALDSFEELAVTGLVLGLDAGNHLEGYCDLGEAFLAGHLGCFGIEDCPLLVLALGCCAEVLKCGGLLEMETRLQAFSGRCPICAPSEGEWKMRESASPSEGGTGQGRAEQSKVL